MNALSNAEKGDRLLDALNHRYRRRLLAALSEHNPQSVGSQPKTGLTVESAADVDRSGATSTIEVVHNHLPKLENYGYVEWDESSDQISKGEHFEEVETLLALLRRHEDELGVNWV